MRESAHAFGGMMNSTGKNGGNTFGNMSEERRREIASKGGKAAHAKGKAYEFTPEAARIAGKKGGLKVSADRAHMAEIGRKGGHAVSGDRQHMAEIGRQGGLATTAAASPIAAQHC